MQPRRRRPRLSPRGRRPVRISPQLAARTRRTSAPRRPGGDLGWATREAYVKEFSDALFAHAEAGRHRRPGQDAVRLPRHQARGRRGRARAELRGGPRRTRTRVSSRARRQTLFYEKSQQLADESFAALTRTRQRGQEARHDRADGRDLHATGRRRPRQRPQADRSGVQRRGARASGRTASRSSSARKASWCCA